VLRRKREILCKLSAMRKETACRTSLFFSLLAAI
jgi:hypothetical protein